METAGQTTLQESAVHARRQAACWWPLDTTACSLDLDDASTFSSSSLLLGWDPQLCCFGSLHARDSELFGPTCRSRFACLQGLHSIPFPSPHAASMADCARVIGMESPVSEASAAAATGGELDDELLMVNRSLLIQIQHACNAMQTL